MNKTQTMTREAFIAEHVVTCQAAQCKKYDRKNGKYASLHSLEYSRRKCAKALWKQLYERKPK